MDNAELGRRLKSARLAKKMTQSDVVGSFITRNMLSQIESGTATPSMKTLEYLSGVLELPLEKLLSESGGKLVFSGSSSALIMRSGMIATFSGVLSSFFIFRLLSPISIFSAQAEPP